MGRRITGIVTAITASDKSNFSDSSLSEAMLKHDLRGGSFVRMLTGTSGNINAVRRISTVQADSGTISLTRPLPAVPAVNDTFEIFRGVDPGDLGDRLNDALPKLYYVEEVTKDLTGLSPTQDWVLKGTGSILSTDIVRDGDLLDIQHESGTAAAADLCRQYVWWKPLITATKITMRTYPIYTTGSLIFKIKRYYSTLATDTTATTCPDELAITGAIVQYWTWLRQPGAAGRLRGTDEVPQIDQSYKAAMQDFAVACALDLPRIFRRRQTATPFILK
jgi:hypothetical protein